MIRHRTLLLSAAVTVLMIATSVSGDPPPAGPPVLTLLASGLEGASGSTVGPDGALYVTEGAAGRISRVDPDTGLVTTFASGLPTALIGIGGPIDLVFVGGTAYVLVTLVAPDVGGSDIVGIYRIDGPGSFTPIADIGAFSVANPPATAFAVPTGLQYAIERFRGGFLVTDGHHNRVLSVTRSGQVSELIAFGNIVPTGVDVAGQTVYLALAGAAPHLPEDGMVVSFGLPSLTTAEIASGARLLVDVEFGRGRRLYALSQGIWDGVADGSPALPNTGALVEVSEDGTFTTIVDALNQPTSVEFIRNTAYVVTLGGEIWKIEDFAGPPYGTPSD